MDRSYLAELNRCRCSAKLRFEAAFRTNSAEAMVAAQEEIERLDNLIEDETSGQQAEH
jgi:hypothetical protein